MWGLNDPLLGRSIAQYDILARVGGGAMGVVYRARDTKLGRLVALKFLPQQWSHDESAKQRFVREAQAASATHHPTICTIHDIGTAEDGQLFIVMALYEGPTLKQRLERGAMPIGEALEIATQMAEGLAKAHAQGIVHRDIKPGNIMLTEDGVRILDFGLATFVDALKLTAENTSFGTPAYMSPEQVRGQAADARSDVWAVGVVLYEMLAGHVPFQGSHPEAIASAIRNEAPDPLQAKRPEIPEEVEQLVFRALHKDPAVRFQSGRELARTLHQIRGLSVPLELRTAPVVSPSSDRRRRTRSRIPIRAAAAALIAAAAAAAWWITRPVERVLVVVAPVSNQTGFEELQPFRLALTHQLTSRLSGSESVRVVPYERVLQILRRFLFDRADVASRDVVEAIAADSGARFVLVPTMLYDSGLWRARIELRDPGTGLNVHTYQTAGVPTSIATDAAFAFMEDLAAYVDRHLASRRAAARQLLRLSDRSSDRRSVRTLDAARHLEAGIRAYAALELASARRDFTAAAERDRRSALAMAWLTRVNMLMRQDGEAGERAARAFEVIDAQTPREDSLFTEAVAAEAMREYDVAEARYRELVERHADDPSWLMELAGFQDRRTQNAEAIATYHQALALDPRLTRAHLELCRLYSPNRTNESIRARNEGEQALAEYRRSGDQAGEAQALFCLVDVLRVGGDGDRAQALAHATSALGILERLGLEYNIVRARNYLALIAGSGGDMPVAVQHWEQALAGARATGNRLMAPRVLNNLGVSYQALGDRARAVESYRQSYALNEELGDEQEAARTRANAGALLIEYGNLDEGLRDVQSAQRVAESLTDKAFEVLCLQLIGAYHRQTGRYDEAVRILTQARSVAVERRLAARTISSTIDLALVHLEAGHYREAREWLVQALAGGSDRESTRAHAILGLVHLRVGRFDAAESELALALQDARRGDLLPFVRLSRGELAYERGQIARARDEWRQAAAAQSDGGLSDPAGVEAGALLDVLPASGSGRAGIDACLRESEQKHRLGLQLRCRVYEARALVQQGAPARALEALSRLQSAEGFEPAPEVLAQIHHWRAEALAGTGDSRQAAIERARAGAVLAALRQSLPAEDQQTFLQRRDLRQYFRGQDK